MLILYQLILQRLRHLKKNGRKMINISQRIKYTKQKQFIALTLNFDISIRKT